MQVKIFETSWGVSLHRVEEEINKFLTTLPEGAVKHVTTAMAATRTGADTDQSETEYVMTIWYDEKAK